MPESLAKRIGRHIAVLRQARNMTQYDLAAAAGISRSWLSSFELGTHPNLGMANFERICLALDMTVKEFFESLPGD